MEVRQDRFESLIKAMMEKGVYTAATYGGIQKSTGKQRG